MTAGGLRLCRSSRAQACGAAPGCGRGSGCASSEASLVGSANLPVPRKQDKGLRWLTLVRRPSCSHCQWVHRVSGRRALQLLGRVQTKTVRGGERQDDGPERGWETRLGDESGVFPGTIAAMFSRLRSAPNGQYANPRLTQAPTPGTEPRSRLAADPSAPTPQLWRKAGQAAETSEW